MKEIWKDIPGYEGLYQVSNHGRVKSLSRKVIEKTGKTYMKNEIIMKQAISNGYYNLNLCKNSKRKNKTVHVLVAMAFLGHKPDGYTIIVDHKDDNKLNNKLSNLQLISQRNNCSKKGGGTSKYVGVSWSRSRKKWCAAIVLNGKTKNLGRFNCEIKAAAAYQAALKNIK